MIQGTTPTHTFTLPFDTSLITKVRVIYAQDDEVKIIKETPDCTLHPDRITLTLTQEDTLKLDHTSSVEIQVRVLTVDNNALASVPMKVGVAKCLDTEVFE